MLDFQLYGHVFGKSEEIITYFHRVCEVHQKNGNLQTPDRSAEINRRVVRLQ